MKQDYVITDELGRPYTVTRAAIEEMRARVKRGAKFLDKKIPGWRAALRRHKKAFDICDGECCVMGTLFRHPPASLKGRLKGISRAWATDEYWTMLEVLGFHRSGGLLVDKPTAHAFYTDSPVEHHLADILWRMEFAGKDVKA